MTSDPKSDVVFRRFRRGKDGTVYDAHDFGVKAWPINRRKRKKR